MTEDTRSTEPCLDPETVAAFIDGRLAPEARARCEAHLAECDDCYELFVETVRTGQELRELDAASVVTPIAAAGRSAPRPEIRRWRLAMVGLAAAAALAVLTAAIWRATNPSVDRQIAELVAPQGGERPTLARLTATREWSRAPGVYRGDGTRSAVPPSRTIAAARLEEQLTQNRTAATVHAFGIAQLTLGHADAAVAALEESVRLAPKDAAAWADLSAAYYERAAESDAALNIPKGLEAANTAIALGGADATAWFNKALLLERLRTRPQAIEAWRRFLAIETNAGWAEEARQRLAALEKESTLRRPVDTQAQRDLLMDDPLGRWGSAVHAVRRSVANG